MIRRANLGDLDALVQLETLAFDSDRLSRRSFRHWLTRGNAILLVDTGPDSLHGYALVRFRARSPVARLYSLAVNRRHRHQGLGRALLLETESAAREHGAERLVLEVREDNRAAASLYEHMGFRMFGRYLQFYADRSDALRLEKPLWPSLPGVTPDFATNQPGAS